MTIPYIFGPGVVRRFQKGIVCPKREFWGLTTPKNRVLGRPTFKWTTSLSARGAWVRWRAICENQRRSLTPAMTQTLWLTICNITLILNVLGGTTTATHTRNRKESDHQH